MYSLRSIVQWSGSYRGKALEFGVSFACSSSRAHRGWLTSGNPLCGWARATSRTSVRSEKMKELCTPEAYDESPSTAGQKKTLEQLSKRHRNQSRRHWTSLLQLTLLLLHLQHQKCMKTRTRNTEMPAEDEEMQRKTPDTDDTWGFELKQKREAHRNTRSHFREETVDDEIIHREASVLMPVEIENSYLLNTVNTFLQ